MSDLLLIAIAAATINNIVLERLLGLCPVLGSDAPFREALATGLATTIALMLTVALGHGINEWLLAPFGLGYLRIIALLGAAALSVRFVNTVLARRGQRAASLPLVTLNCAVLGVALLTTGTAESLSASVALGLGAGVGFTVVVVLFASLRARLDQATVPAPLRGPALALTTVGMMSLAFQGFSGLGS